MEFGWFAPRVLAAASAVCCVVGLVAVTDGATAATTTPTRAWSSINFDNANTSDDASETALSSATLSTLHPVQQGHFLDESGHGAMVIASGRIFDTCSSSVQDTVGICAWSQSSLQPLWRTSIPGGDPGETNLSASAGELFVHADGAPYLALEQSTGATIWQVTDPDPVLTTYVPPPIVTSSVEAYLDNHGRLVERSLTTGAQLSRTAPAQLSPTAANNTLLAEVAGDVVVGQNVYRLYDDGLTATPLTCPQTPCLARWTASAPQYAQRIVYAEGRLFVDGEGGIEAFSAATGAAEFVLTPFDDSNELLGGVQYLEAADDLIFASSGHGDVLSAWKVSGCAAAVCPSIWQADPVDQANSSAVFAETGGKLYTQGGWVYAPDAVQHSAYGPAGSPTHLKVTTNDSTCLTSLSWTPPADTGALPLTGSTVTLSNGDVTQGSADGTDFYFQASGHYIATVSVDTAWGPGAGRKINFTVPKCG